MNQTIKSNIDSLGSSQSLLNILDEYLILSKTDANGTITFASEGFCKISGYTQDELIGKSHNMVRSEYTKDELFIDLWTTIKSGNKWHGEIKNKRKNGSYYWVDATIMCERDTNGKIVGFNALRHDITSKKELEELNRTLEKKIKAEVEKNKIKNQHMMQQTKAAQMGEMMDAVAHQWKQPLSVISILAQSLRIKMNSKKGLDPQYLSQQTDDIQLQIHHMIDTIDTFRTFFRLNETFEHVSIDELIKDTLTILKSALEAHKIKIEIVGNQSLSIYCIKSEFIHTLINFINNAKDAFDENKIVNKKIIFEIKQNKNRIVFNICDNAGGIPKHILKNVFDANFTTKPKGKGSGIGLYMTKQILEKLGARIEVFNKETKDGVGACFSITI